MAHAELDVGAVVVDDVDLDAAHGAVAHHGELDLVDAVRAVVVAVGDVVDPVLQVGHLSPGGPRAHGGDHRRLVGEQLGAEAAAGRHRPDVQLVGGHLERVRGHEQVAGEAQRVGVDGEAAGARVVLGDRADGLQRLPARAVPAEPVPDDHLGLGEVALDIAEVEGALVGAVRLQGLVYQRGPVGQSALRVDHRGQRLVLDLDELQRVLGQVAAVRDDDRDALADVPHLVRRQAAPGVPGRVGAEVGHRVAQLGGVGAGDHRVHAGCGQSLGGLDPQDPGVRVRAAQHGGVQGAGGDPVGDVAAPAEQELRVLDAADRLAHPAPLGGVVADGGRGGGPVDGGHEATSFVARIRAAAPITASVMNW